MNIKIEILDSEVEVLENGATVERVKLGGQKKADARMISTYENAMGKLYALVVLPDGSIDRIPYNFIKVIDNQYV